MFASTVSRPLHPLTSSLLSSALHFLYAKKHPETIAKTWSRARCMSNEPVRYPSKSGGNADRRSLATSRTGNNMSGDNCGHSGDRLSQNGEKQHVKTATTRVYTFTA